MENTSNSAIPYGTRIENLAKIALLITSVSFAVGVYVSAADLARFHAEDFSFTRPQYVFVGGTWLVMTALVIGLPGLAGYLVKHFRLKRTQQLTLYASSVFLGQFLLAGLVDADDLYGSLSIPIVLLEQIIVIVLSRQIPRFKFRPATATATWKGRSRNRYALAVTLMYGVFITPLWVPTYSESIYPYLPQYLGGGEHPVATLTFQSPEKGSDPNQYAHLIDPLQLKNPTRSCPVRIVSIGSEFVVIANQGLTQGAHNSVYVSKRLINSIQYASKDVGSDWQFKLLDKVWRWAHPLKNKNASESKVLDVDG